MPIKFEFLQHSGESIVVTLEDGTSLLIDGGRSHPFDNDYPKESSEKNIKTIVVTHIDDDHIAGIIELLECVELLPSLESIIFNEPKSSQLFSIFNKDARTSAAQGTTLAKLIEKDKKLVHLSDVCLGYNDCIQLTPDTCLKILSPSPEGLDKLHKKWNLQDYMMNSRRTAGSHLNEHDLSKGIEELAARPLKPDPSLPNESSLAFLLESGKRKFLLLGDAHIPQITAGLKRWGYSPENPLYADFIKLSHHGSRCNISREFLESVRTNTFIVCQAYDNLLKHPDRETVAKIAKYGKAMRSDEKKSIYLTKDITPARHLSFSDTEKDRYKFHIKTMASQTLSYEL